MKKKKIQIAIGGIALVLVIGSGIVVGTLSSKKENNQVRADAKNAKQSQEVQKQQATSNLDILEPTVVEESEEDAKQVDKATQDNRTNSKKRSTDDNINQENAKQEVTQLPMQEHISEQKKNYEELPMIEHGQTKPSDSSNQDKPSKDENSNSQNSQPSSEETQDTKGNGFSFQLPEEWKGQVTIVWTSDRMRVDIYQKDLYAKYGASQSYENGRIQSFLVSTQEIPLIDGWENEADVNAEYSLIANKDGIYGYSIIPHETTWLSADATLAAACEALRDSSGNIVNSLVFE